MPSEAYSLVRRAVVERLIVVAVYGGLRREMCPHMIGYKDGRENALFFQFGGGSESGLPSGGQWRCIHVPELSDISLREGPWRTGHGRSEEQTCVDEVDVEVPY